MAVMRMSCLLVLCFFAQVTLQQRQDPCSPSPCGVNTYCTVSSTGAGVCRCEEGWDHAPGSNTIEGCPVRINRNTHSSSSNRHRGSTSSNRHRGSTSSRRRPSSVLGNRLGSHSFGVTRQGASDLGDPCFPDPCGENTECSSAGNRAVCSCRPGHKGDPYIRCSPDPCSLNPCGVDAECINRNDRAECRCPPGFTGDPYVRCQDDPCNQNPSPCADNAICESRGNRAICTCRDGFSGDPFVRCTIDPCVTDPCGINAECSSNGDNAVCTCLPGYEGDPYRRCNLNPCADDPCGPNAECRAQGNSARCSCLPGYVGNPASRSGCRLEPCSQDPCGIDAECESRGRTAVCKCPRGYTGDPYVRCSANPCSENPCGANAICENRGDTYDCRCPSGFVGSGYSDCVFNPCAEEPCGPNAECTVSGDRAICECRRGYLGSPYDRGIGCRADPCSVTQSCGTNAECRNEPNQRSGTGSLRPVCYCPAGHVGDPYQACYRGECVGNSDCPSHQACKDYQCVDPCQTACGNGADCNTRNHVAICTCPRGYTGDPFERCRRFTREEICAACGANTNCEVGPDDTPICSCKENYIGNPLTECRHECESDYECADQQKCSNFRCVPVCDQDACGENANCKARNHRAQCTCPEDFLGDGYTRCYTECIRHTDCRVDQACHKFRCIDPCVVPKQVCGRGADCNVKNHKPICSCPKGFTGDPFVSCRRFTREDLCVPNPCGTDAICQPGYDRSGNDKPVCTCPPGYRGDPLVACRRGDCDVDSDCPDNRGCYNYRCEDPCLRDACGPNADCRTRNHAAICTCADGYVGDPLVGCRRVREGSSTRIIGQSRRRYRRAIDYISSFFF